MTKFIEALKVQIDHSPVRAKPPMCLSEPIMLKEDFVRMGLQNRYELRLTWNIGVWLDMPSANSAIEEARLDAMAELKSLVYGEIYPYLGELKHHVRYGDQDKSIDIIDRLRELIDPRI